MTSSRPRGGSMAALVATGAAAAAAAVAVAVAVAAAAAATATHVLLGLEVR